MLRFFGFRYGSTSRKVSDIGPMGPLTGLFAARGTSYLLPPVETTPCWGPNEYEVGEPYRYKVLQGSDL